jgi:hypothetical protein
MEAGGVSSDIPCINCSPFMQQELYNLLPLATTLTDRLLVHTFHSNDTGYKRGLPWYALATLQQLAFCFSVHSTQKFAHYGHASSETGSTELTQTPTLQNIKKVTSCEPNLAQYLCFLSKHGRLITIAEWITTVCLNICARFFNQLHQVVMRGA